ncbi:family 1 glycosylhydrolase [Nonomuraea sp. NPDC049480]|uniref:family 1 glycosylhydrolase n=1 Tax=Nonomuraea sp. NPDC049480 TaxID=3364353 RepID=UPI0037A4F57D
MIERRMRTFPDGFLWGAATAPHQVEGNNVNSDFWAQEERMPGADRSGDALDSYHRYAEDIRLVAESGLNTYRFGIEWARIEPAPGRVSRAALAHYRRMIDACLAAGVTPFVTIHHFTSPRWFSEEGGWRGERAVDRFRAYAETATSILDGVEWVCTINEPNMLAIMVREAEATLDPGSGLEWLSPTLEADTPRPVKPAPPVEIGRRLVEAHHAARDVLREGTDARVGWSVASRAFETRPGAEEVRRRLEYVWEDVYLEAARGDDSRRIAYTTGALDALSQALGAGVDVQGYIHWSLLDNYEWGHWDPTFGLVAVDRETFERRPKPSLAWLGGVAKANAL